MSENKEGKASKDGKKEKKKKEKGPLKQIYIAYKINGLSNISAYTCTFVIDMKVFFWWKDETLIGTPKGTNIDYSEGCGLYEPNIVVTNEFDLHEVSNITAISDSETGEVKRTVTYKGTCFIQSMTLDMFPYDCQNVQICFKPYKLPIDEAIMIPRSPEDCACANSVIQEWDLLGHFIKTFETDPLTSSTGKVYSTAYVTVLMRRRSGWFIWNVYIPTATFLFLSWLTFLYGTDAAAEKNDVIMNTLLASFSLKFTVSGQIPRVDYPTFLDYFVYFCFFSQFSALFFSQFTAYAEEHYGMGNEANMCCMLFQFASAALCFEWMYAKLHNHSIDVRQWVQACEEENEKNLKVAKNMQVEVSKDVAKINSDMLKKARRKSYFDIIMRHDDVIHGGEFTSFGASSVDGSSLNKS